MQSVFGDMGRVSRLYETVNKINGKTYQFYNFWTTGAPDFITFRDMFYKDGVKIVPSNIADLIKSPLSLAVWVMEDGCLQKRNKGFYLCTDSFSYNDQILLKKAILDNFGLNVNIVKYASKYFRLRFGAKETKKVSDIIRPYVIESMKYKLLD